MASRFARLALLLLALSVVPPTARAGSIGGTVTCQTSGLLYANSTVQAQVFILVLEAVVNVGGNLSPVTLHWTFPSGDPGSATMGAQASEAFAIAVAAGSTVTFSCGGGEALTWSLTTGSGGGRFDCAQAPFAGSGTFLDNLSGISGNLLVSLGGNQPNARPITVSVAWTDPQGQSHSARVGNIFSVGGAISLGTGGALSYTCDTPVAGSWSFSIAP